MAMLNFNDFCCKLSPQKKKLSKYLENHKRRYRQLREKLGKQIQIVVQKKESKMLIRGNRSQDELIGNERAKCDEDLEGVMD